MDVTVSCLANAERSAIGPSLSDRLHFHIEARLLCTGDVEGCVTVGFVTLNAGAGATLLADVACKLPACRRDVLNTIDGLQKDCVSKADLRGKQQNSLHCNTAIRNHTLIYVHYKCTTRTVKESVFVQNEELNIL